MEIPTVYWVERDEVWGGVRGGHLNMGLVSNSRSSSSERLEEGGTQSSGRGHQWVPSQPQAIQPPGQSDAGDADLPGLCPGFWTAVVFCLLVSLIRDVKIDRSGARICFSFTRKPVRNENTPYKVKEKHSMWHWLPKTGLMK